MDTKLYDEKGLRPFLVILLALLAIVISGGLTYWYFTNQANKNQDTLKSQINNLENAIMAQKNGTSTSTTTTPTPSPTTTATTTPSTSPSATTTTSPTPATSVVYTNTKYGFQLTFPSTWAEYKVGEKNQPTYGYIYYFGLPYVESTYLQDPDMPAGSASLFALTVFTKAQWAQVQADGGPFPTVVSETDQYVFAWGQGQAYPTELATFRADMNGIIASFKLL